MLYHNCNVKKSSSSDHGNINKKYFFAGLNTSAIDQHGRPSSFRKFEAFMEIQSLSSQDIAKPA